MSRARALRDGRPPAEEPPPFLGTWPRVYAAVIGWLATLILLFYVFARAFNA